MTLALLILTSCALIGVIELLKRRFSLPTYLTRRVIHVGTACVAGVAPLFVTQKDIIIVSILFAAALVYGRRHGMFSAIHSVHRQTYGEVFLPLGVALTALVFLPQEVIAYQFGVFVMGISDPLAGIIGERFGTHRVLFLQKHKSIEGSLVFFASTAILAFAFLPVLDYRVVLIAATLTLVEFALIYGLDNLLLPVVGALLVSVVF